MNKFHTLIRTGEKTDHELYYGWWEVGRDKIESELRVSLNKRYGEGNYTREGDTFYHNNTGELIARIKEGSGFNN